MRPLVFSLTPAGARVADRLGALWPAARHHHRPAHLAEVLREAYRAGHPLACIMSAGIVCRILAPVLEDKRHAPPVLVLDEAGGFVVSLLSGHEGGANAWAWETAFALRARGLESQAVITSAHPYLRRARVVGMGCARHTSEVVLRGLLDQILERAGWTLASLSALATIDLKVDEAGLRALAERLSLPLVTFPAQRLAALGDRLANPSPVVAAAVGCPGVAEAAALACAEGFAGGRAVLVVEKTKTSLATAALAEAEPEEER